MKMFTLHCSPQSILGFHRPILRAEKSSLNLGHNVLPQLSHFRCYLPVGYLASEIGLLTPKAVVGMQAKQRLTTVFSVNSNSSKSGSGVDKSGEVKASEDSSTRGPPFLTILAGFIVLFLVVKVFGSIIFWLFSLIVNVPKSS